MSTNTRFPIVAPTYPNREQQDIENRRAIAALAELLENAITVSENFLSYTDGRLPPLGAKGATLQAAANEMLTRYRHEQPCGWDEDGVMNHCKQQVTKERIAEISNRPRLDVNSIATSLKQLCTKEKIPRGRYLVNKENLGVLKSHRGPDAVIDLPEALAALHDIQHVDATATIRDELAEMDAEKNRLLAQVKEAQAAYDGATGRGDIIEVERAHRHLIAARYEYVVFSAKRVNHLNSNENDEDINSFADQLKQLQEEAEAGVKEFKAEKEKMKEALLEDIAKCDETLETEKSAHEAAAAAYAEQESGFNTQLEEVVARKLEVVAELREKAAELRDLMEQQKGLVQGGIDAKRTEEERVTTHNEFLQLEAQHRERLEMCLAYYNGCEPVQNEIEKYVEEMVQNLPRDDVAEALVQILDAEASSFMDAYKDFVFICGDLTVKKCHRLDTLERQTRLMRHNRDSAMDSLDPNLENYRIEIEDLVGQMKAVEGVVNALNATQDAGEQVFESIEDAVQAMYERSGKTFVHPLQEFGHKSVDERTRFVDRSMRYVENEEQEVSGKKNQIQEMRAVVSQENYALEKAIAAGGNRYPAAAIADKEEPEM